MLNKDHINVLGIEITVISMEDALKLVRNWLEEDSVSRHIVTPNPEMLYDARKDVEFQSLLNSADLQLPDGVGLQVAAEISSSSIPNILVLREFVIAGIAFVALLTAALPFLKFRVIPERVTGVDFFSNMVRVAAVKNNDDRFFLLGGAPGVAVKARALLVETYPGVKIAGVSDGGAVDEKGRGKNDNRLVRKVNESEANILLVCFGAPAQDYWIRRNLHKLNKIKVAIGAGGTLDFIVKKQNRAPKLFQKANIEWVWRLLHEPKRICRVVKAFPFFPIVVTFDKYNMVKSTHDK